MFPMIYCYDFLPALVIFYQWLCGVNGQWERDKWNKVSPFYQYVKLLLENTLMHFIGWV